MDIPNITPATTWTGAFSWDGLFLRAHIKSVIRDYNIEDPHTWPLIQSIISTDDGEDYRMSRALPYYLAYEQSLMKDCIKHIPLKQIRSSSPKNDGQVAHNALFYAYPFNFTPAGRLRDYPHIPKHQLKEWSKWYPSSPTADAQATSVQPKKRSQDGSRKDVSSEVAYKDIISTLSNSIISSPSVVVKLEKDLSQAKYHIRNLKERNDDLTKQASEITRLKSEKDQLNIELAAAERFEPEVKRLEVELAAAKRFEPEVKRMEVELAATKQEAEQRIIKIWELVKENTQNESSVKKRRVAE